MTERGAQAQKAARDIVTQIERDWSLLLGSQDFTELRSLLKRLHDALWPDLTNTEPAHQNDGFDERGSSLTASE